MNYCPSMRFIRLSRLTETRTCNTKVPARNFSPNDQLLQRHSAKSRRRYNIYMTTRFVTILLHRAICRSAIHEFRGQL